MPTLCIDAVMSVQSKFMWYVPAAIVMNSSLSMNR